MRSFTLLFLLLLALELITPTALHAQADAERTEEYAVINAWQQGRRTFISVQIGSESTPDREFEGEKGEKRFDMSPVIREMEALNTMGFELVTGSTAIIPVSTGSPSQTGLPYYTFIFKRRLQ